MLPATLTGGLLLAGAAAAGAGLLVHAAYSPESQLFGPTLLAGSNPMELALTFDDGPNDVATEELLDLLERHGARASFFMIGRFVQMRPALARKVLAAGHLVGNHTMTHPWLTWQSAAVVREELYACSAAIEDAVGASVRYFRAPHGARRPTVLRVAHELGLVPVQWNIMAHDWEQIGPEAMLARIEQGLRRCRRRGVGANLLLHDGYDRQLGADRSATVKLTAHLLPTLAQRGYSLVGVDAWG